MPAADAGSIPAFIKPCLPCVALLPPSSREWLHEIKHPGYRLIARREGAGVRCARGSGASVHPTMHSI
jgi:ATP-dependent DNA ligase